MRRFPRKTTEKLSEFGGTLLALVVLDHAVLRQRIGLLGVRHRSDVAFGRLRHGLAVSWVFPSEGLQFLLESWPLPRRACGAASRCPGATFSNRCHWAYR